MPLHVVDVPLQRPAYAKSDGASREHAAYTINELESRSWLRRAVHGVASVRDGRARPRIRAQGSVVSLSVTEAYLQVAPTRFAMINT